MPCLRGYLIAVAAAFVGAALAAPAALYATIAPDEGATCSAGEEGDDTAGLLQLSGQSQAVTSQVPSIMGKCGCKNFALCLETINDIEVNFCFCNNGWAGETCEVPAESDRRDPVDHIGGGGTCGLGFAVYPYGEQDYWGTSYSGWQTCRGFKQSPINIQTKTANKVNAAQPLENNFGLSSEQTDYVHNNGHSLEVPGDFGSVMLDDLRYDSNQFHFHTPSEHQINGRGTEMEMHIVTKNAKTGTNAVVAIFLQVGTGRNDHNSCLEKVFKSPAPKAGCDKPVGTIDLSCFEPQLKGSWWSYDGSLTTPPCTEGVKWMVMKETATISKAQFDVFQTRFTVNARKPQEVYNRAVTYHSRR